MPKPVIEGGETVFPEAFVWLDPPASLGEVTVLDVLEAKEPAGHKRRVERWAKSVWEACSPHHETVRRDFKFLSKRSAVGPEMRNVNEIWDRRPGRFPDAYLAGFLQMPRGKVLHIVETL